MQTLLIVAAITRRLICGGMAFVLMLISFAVLLCTVPFRLISQCLLWFAVRVLLEPLEEESSELASVLKQFNERHTRDE